MLSFLNHILAWITEHLEGVGGDQFDEAIKPKAGALIGRAIRAVRGRAVRPVAYPAWQFGILVLGLPAVLAIVASERASIPKLAVYVLAAVPVPMLIAFEMVRRKRERDDKLTPDLSRYLTDTFEETAGIRWRWSWKGGVADDDVMERVVNLRAYCPKCGMRFAYSFEDRYSMLVDRTYPRVAFACPATRPPCGYHVVLDGDLEQIGTTVRRRIEHRVNTGEWVGKVD